jgi:hypothetical protein
MKESTREKLELLKAKRILLNRLRKKLSPDYKPDLKLVKPSPPPKKMKGLRGYGWEAHEHLKKHRPKMYAQLIG